MKKLLLIAVFSAALTASATSQTRQTLRPNYQPSAAQQHQQWLQNQQRAANSQAVSPQQRRTYQNQYPNYINGNRNAVVPPTHIPPTRPWQGD